MNILRKSIIALFALTAFGTTAAQASGTDDESTKKIKLEKAYRFRVTLADKKQNPYSIKQPEKFLSAKALARRAKYKIAVDNYDLPITPKYIDALKNAGAKIHNMSKWNNTVVVETPDSLLCDKIKQLPFVSNVRHVWTAPDSVDAPNFANRQKEVTNRPDTLEQLYGKGFEQISQLNALRLHEAGFTGKGVTIAVLDGGFHNADCITAWRKEQILGTRNFVRPERSVYDELSHGMMVLSCIASRVPHSLIGTAPDASFYLIVCEDGESEQLVEEDNWCAAIEYADSLGADIATSSLGYTGFDHKWMDFPYHALDGQTELCSRSASLAASRGILVLNSAGNSGMSSWKKIGVPADAKDILAVGAVNETGENTWFSSIGNSADGRIKPDVMARGGYSAVLDTNGENAEANGTSFSCPILCGVTACLMQASPQSTPVQIIRALQSSGHNAAHPDNIFGYGIPDAWKAYESMKH